MAERKKRSCEVPVRLTQEEYEKVRYEAEILTMPMAELFRSRTLYGETPASQRKGLSWDQIAQIQQSIGKILESEMDFFEKYNGSEDNGELALILDRSTTSLRQIMRELTELGDRGRVAG